MREENGRDEIMWEQLYRLSTMPAVPEFTRELYGLIVEWSVEAEDAAAADLTLRLLEVETRYYRQLERADEGHGQPEVATEKRNIGLELLIERARARGARTERNAEIARQLIMAECSYHLERHSQVVSCLERALDLGASDPLLYFALGHARFLLARSNYVGRDMAGELVAGSDQAALQSLCLAAVTAFEGALTGGSRDAEVLWWIGRVLQTAGFNEVASEVFAQADVRSKDEEDEMSEIEKARHDAALLHPMPITQQELVSFVDGISNPHPLSNLL
ncbi:MAG TPA: hypothetical protein VGM19_03655 [Armatimonadota bacterium]|jgi:tetratricopeptide (TPR) repeat protein